MIDAYALNRPVISPRGAVACLSPPGAYLAAEDYHADDPPVPLHDVYEAAIAPCGIYTERRRGRHGPKRGPRHVHLLRSPYSRRSHISPTRSIAARCRQLDRCLLPRCTSRRRAFLARGTRWTAACSRALRRRRGAGHSGHAFVLLCVSDTKSRIRTLGPIAQATAS